MTPSRSSARSGARATLVAITLVYILLAGLLLIDVARAGDHRIYPPRKVARTLLEIAEKSGRVRAINPIIAQAARQAGTPNVALELPEGYPSLLNLTQDNFSGKPTSTLNAGLMAPFIGGRVKTVAYDPVLSEIKAAEIESDARAVALPRNVWTLAGIDGVSVVRLYTNPARTHVYIIPADVAGDGAQ